MYLLGYDIGSSSIKAALIDVDSGKEVGVEKYPNVEMEMISKEIGWAEQHPEDWWKFACMATERLLSTRQINTSEIKAIGISYQMHGLVMVDKDQNVIRPSIIWCDSRAIHYGERAFSELGKEKCLSQLLNSPGNFTASKLKWVAEHEPDNFEKIHKIMLPGDYIAMKMTGEICTTVSGLSEGILWDFQAKKISADLMNYYGFSNEIIPAIVPTFSIQGKLTANSAKEMGLSAGIPITYRAGDQPNNALSLNVLEGGDVAATGGTSGVVYGVLDNPIYDPKSRVNGFAHVNYDDPNPNIGVLLCINGAGILYGWLKKQLGETLSYPDMENLGSEIPIGSQALRVLPFGNGAERMLENKVLGAQINNLQLNHHNKAHLIRASLEGIAFSFVYGMKILQEMNVKVNVIKAGNDNLFQSQIFSSTISNILGNQIDVIETTGAIGAAKAAGVAIGIYSTPREAMKNNHVIKSFEPGQNRQEYIEAYNLWENDLQLILNN